MECKCGNKLFYVQNIVCCDDCSENGAHDGGGYIYDEKIIDEKSLTRDEVNEDGQCKLDTAFGAGCYLFICKECNKKTNIALMDGC